MLNILVTSPATLEAFAPDRVHGIARRGAYILGWPKAEGAEKIFAIVGVARSARFN